MESLQKFINSWVLSLIIISLVSPIVFYAYSDSKTVKSIQNIENPLIFSANRYLTTGDWPASRANDKLISNHQYYSVKVESN